MLIIITDRTKRTKRVQHQIEGPSKTEQSHIGSTNINKIVAKYKKTGFMNQSIKKPTFGDFTESGDFHNIKNRIIQADKDFLTIPAEIRDRFNNDPGELLDFINDPENASDCVKMGLIEKMTPDIQSEEEKPLETEPEASPEQIEQ